MAVRTEGILSLFRTSSVRYLQFGGLALCWLSLSACLPEAIEVQEGFLRANAAKLWSIEVDARLPTDVLPVEGGDSFLVLDSYRERLLLYDREGLVSTTDGAAEWQSPVRMAQSAGGGVWLVEPEHGLRLVDELGQTLRDLPASRLGPDVEPVAMLDVGDALIVSDRDGRIWWLSRQGEAKLTVDSDVDGEPLGAIVDLVRRGDEVFAVDTLNACVHVFDKSGEPLSRFGWFGMWTGSLHKPKGLAITPDGAILIADSALGIQMFGTREEGPPFPVGRVSENDDAVPVGHAIAAELVDDRGTFLVLDQLGETVFGFTVPFEEVAAAGEASGIRSLRESVVDHSERTAGVGESTCQQCHDGLINDDRRVWDPDLFRHPVDVAPERDIPPFFPLSEDGTMRCSTCHSPHGVVSLDAARATHGSAHRIDLARHQSDGEQFTRLTRGDSALCIACHGEDPHSKEEGTPGGHPAGQELARLFKEQLREKGELEVETPGCMTCHTVHGAANAELGRSTSDAGLCGTCHEDQAMPETNHPVGRNAEDALLPADGSEIPVTPSGRPQCSSCHDLLSGEGDKLLRVPADGNVLCVTCHEDQLTLTTETDAHARVDGDHEIVCLGCHMVHGEPREAQLTRAEGARRAGDPKGCLSCHAPGRREARRGRSPARLGHPVDGKMHDGRLLVCGACHDAHEPTPGERAVCERCHEGNAALIEDRGHGTAICEDCHEAHSRNTMGGPASMNPRSRRCLGCHAAGMSSANTPVVPPFEHPDLEFPEERDRLIRMEGMRLFAPNGTPLEANINGDLTCSTCHYTHGTPRGEKPLEQIRIRGAAEGCEVCHGSEQDARYKYVHEPERWAEEDVWD